MKLLTKFFPLVAALPAILLAFPGAARAQNPVSDAFVVLDSSGVDLVSCRYVVVLKDTDNIDRLEVRLTRFASDTVPMLFQEFDYDAVSGLPAGWTYSRKAGKITLEAGELTKRNSYFGSVRVKTGGSWSSPYNFISQLTF